MRGIREAKGEQSPGGTRGDRFFAFGWSAAIVVMATVPTALAVLMPPPGLTGFGTVMFVNDFAQYEAAMNEATRSDGWLVHDHFTPEPHPAALMFPVYVLLGKLGGALGIGWEPLYRAFEVSGRGLLAAALAAFALRFAHPRHRRLGVILALSGAGIGFWAVIAQGAVGVAQPYGGNGSYELNTYALFLGTPHPALALAATLAAIWLLVEMPDGATLRRAGMLAGCVVAVGLLHPFNLVSLGLVAGVLVVASPGPLSLAERTAGSLSLWERVVGSADSEPRGSEAIGGVRASSSGAGVSRWAEKATALRLQRVLGAAIVALAAAPFVAYNAVTFGRDPFWSRVYGAQNVLPSPSPWELIVDLGAQALGLVGIVLGWRCGGATRNLAVVAATLFIAMYVPVPFQRRLGFGVAPLLAVLATVAFAWWEERQWRTGNTQQRRPSRLLPVACCLLLVAAVSTPLLVYGGMLISVRTNGPIAAYRATPELKATRDWLAASTGPADVVLGSWDVMNYLAGAIPGSTAGGHPVATRDVARRRGAAESLFLDAPHQERMIQDEGPTYLVSTGPHEPVFVPNARSAYVNGPVQVVSLLLPAGSFR